MANALHYGDNLRVLRNSVAGESVDLIYLDPPFNSQANYNVLFRSRAGMWWALSLVEAQPYAGKKKGADSGIDGLIYFKADPADGS